MNGSTTRSKKISKDTWNKWKWGQNNPKSVGHRESNPKRDIHSITVLPKKQENNSNTLNFTEKELENEQQTKPKWVEGRK